jgi:hypothetical protein
MRILLTCQESLPVEQQKAKRMKILREAIRNAKRRE